MLARDSALSFAASSRTCIDEGRTVALLVLGVFVLRQAAAELGVELCGVGHLGRGEESAGGKVLLLLSGMRRTVRQRLDIESE